MSKTLQQLKEILGEKEHFGPLSSTNQRIFHMGRELKSGGRSLSNLGLGRFNNHILHLHVVSTSKTVNRGNNSGGSLPKASSTQGRRRYRASSAATASARTRTTTTATTTTSTSSSNERSSSGRNRSSHLPSPSTNNGRFKEDNVIDLLSDSDDEEQEVICLDDAPIEASGTKRRRMR